MSIIKENMIPTPIVPRNRQVKNIIVYLVPFIDEMKVLWKAI